MRSHEHASYHLNLVRNIRFTAPFKVARYNRCSYRTVFSYELNEEKFHEMDIQYHGDYVWDMLSELFPVLSELQSGALISLWWHLGTCLPGHLLDEGGYITRHQPFIRDISLRTDGHCMHAGLRLGGLGILQNIQSLRWEQIVTPDELNILSECLRQNRRQLRVLALTFSPSIKCGHVLATIHELPQLHTLSLTNFKFTEFISTAFSISVLALRSLTLRGCSYQIELLHCWSRMRTEINLEHFEIDFDEALDVHRFDETRSTIIFNFIQRLQNLKRLHMLVSNPISLEGYLRMSNSHPSLETLVLHTKTCLPTEWMRSQETLYIPESYYANTRQMLSTGSFKRVGLCLAPHSAVSPFRFLFP